MYTYNQHTKDTRKTRQKGIIPFHQQTSSSITCRTSAHRIIERGWIAFWCATNRVTGNGNGGYISEGLERARKTHRSSVINGSYRLQALHAVTVYADKTWSGSPLPAVQAVLFSPRLGWCRIVCASITRRCAFLLPERATSTGDTPPPEVVKARSQLPLWGLPAVKRKKKTAWIITPTIASPMQTPRPAKSRSIISTTAVDSLSLSSLTPFVFIAISRADRRLNKSFFFFLINTYWFLCRRGRFSAFHLCNFCLNWLFDERHFFMYWNFEKEVYEIFKVKLREVKMYKFIRLMDTCQISWYKY